MKTNLFYISLFADHYNDPSATLTLYLEYVDKDGKPHFSLEQQDALLFQSLSKAIFYKDQVLQSWVIKNNFTDCFFVHPLAGFELVHKGP